MHIGSFSGEGALKDGRDGCTRSRFGERAHRQDAQKLIHWRFEGLDWPDDERETGVNRERD